MHSCILVSKLNHTWNLSLLQYVYFFRDTTFSVMKFVRGKIAKYTKRKPNAFATKTTLLWPLGKSGGMGLEGL